LRHYFLEPVSQHHLRKPPHVGHHGGKTAGPIAFASEATAVESTWPMTRLMPNRCHPGRVAVWLH
jgi:hypothetical protein